MQAHGHRLRAQLPRAQGRRSKMPPPPHLGIMAPFTTLSHCARSLPVFEPHRSAGRAGLLLGVVAPCFRRQPDTGHSEHPWIKPTSPTPSNLPGTRPGSRTITLLRSGLVCTVNVHLTPIIRAVMANARAFHQELLAASAYHLLSRLRSELHQPPDSKLR